jgi:hypothetical protein
MARGSDRESVFLAPGEGRRYDMGHIQAVFEADGTETAGGVWTAGSASTAGVRCGLGCAHPSHHPSLDPAI